MQFDVLTLFPEMFKILNESIIGRAKEKGLINVNLINIRDFSKNKHKKVDDTPYGGGAGMVIQPDVVYDEQPLGFKQSWTQRTRWSVGHLQCFKYYIKDLAAGVVRNRKMMNVDGLLYLMGMPILIVTLAILVINLIIYLGDGMTLAGLIWNYAKYLLATFIMPPLTALFVLILDKRPIKPMLKGLLCYPLFLGSWILINIKALIKPNTTWEKIDHVRDIKVKS